MRRTVVLNVVGLTEPLLRFAPRLRSWRDRGALARVRAAFPAVTCTAQADYLTGVRANAHGIVGNGWYDRDECEVRFWKQSNRLVQAPKIWDVARRRDPSFTCANLFWWFNMYSSVDASVTPRPMYPADGRKIPDVYTAPADLREELQQALGTFPLFSFWGPKAGAESSRWISEAAKHVDRRFAATLTLVYLPHLDYDLQRFGPDGPNVMAAVREVDELCGNLIDHFGSAGTQVIVLSEYGIRSVAQPVHVNRVLRKNGYVAVRQELGRDYLDPGASAAFAMADHQVAHVYVNDRTRLNDVRQLLESTAGVERVLDARESDQLRVNHRRSGDLIAIASADAWFTYYFWLDDALAPDYARTVDIHRKPGYDPVELFLDPSIRVPALTVGWKLAKRKGGLRSLLDVIPLDATLVKGSHGRRPEIDEPDIPILISQRRDLVPGTPLESTDVQALLLAHVFD